ncbi:MULTISPECIES: methanogen output domain 1-containing protein [unclassified Nostoc]|uniref:methanogen output domain 1-containing protein n=1 Tax=unclassified Nostoc TaxID=2593658 RepID=UPI002AD37A2A|nr:methanogen output domain 1-containing protein [Nostoc sp. DedQUE03]MDZ7973916.1 methanogen output domain 1-containing protein [Nostoc sp. DedQUE03]MDZ8047453.1 methanogen output domain 1-containing protein [Nostoc sp. DedQUE02]
MVDTSSLDNQIKSLELPIERDQFLRTMIRELAGTLQDVVGIEQAEGFLNVVGYRTGQHVNQIYQNALQLSNLSREQVTVVLVDWKRRIQGDFYVIEETDEKIVLGNRKCPFAEQVEGREAMCVMTSNIFGAIAADNLGYARVELQDTIARGAQECKIVIYLKPSEVLDEFTAQEYFKA